MQQCKVTIPLMSPCFASATVHW